MLHVLSNMPSANVSIKFGLKGPSGSTSSACATGTSAIGEAYRNIQLGEVFFQLKKERYYGRRRRRRCS